MHMHHPYRIQIDRVQRTGTAFADQVRQINDDQWDRPTPCEDWTVRELVAHVASIVADLESLALGEPLPPTIPAGELRSGPDVARRIGAALDTGVAEWHRVHLAQSRDFPWGRTPAVRALQFTTVELAGHGWDLMVATGSRPSFRADDLEAVIDVARRHLPAVARPGLFGAATPVRRSAPPFDRVAAALGRPVAMATRS